jgi:SPP1 family predicted phage head-tail adaptor
MAIDAGSLTHRITIEQATETRSASGAVTRTWAELATVWAHPLYRGGREFMAAAQARADLACIWIIRAGVAVTTKMRVKYDARYFDIVSVDDLSDVDRIRLHCIEGQRQGT